MMVEFFYKTSYVKKTAYLQLWKREDGVESLYFGVENKFKVVKIAGNKYEVVSYG